MWGEPVDFEDLVKNSKIESFDDEMSVIEEITNRVQEIVFEMRLQCEELHRKQLEDAGRFDQLASFTSKLIDYKEPVKKTQTFYKVYTE